jgi:hypothetical protein
MTSRLPWPFRSLELVVAASFGVYAASWFLDAIGIRPCGFHLRTVQCITGDVVMYAAFITWLIALLVSAAAVPNAALYLWRRRVLPRPRHYAGLILRLIVLCATAAMFAAMAYNSLINAAAT